MGPRLPQLRQRLEDLDLLPLPERELKMRPHTMAQRRAEKAEQETRGRRCTSYSPITKIRCSRGEGHTGIHGSRDGSCVWWRAIEYQAIGMLGVRDAQIAILRKALETLRDGPPVLARHHTPQEVVYIAQSALEATK